MAFNKNQINDTYCVFISVAININVFIYNYILIRKQLFNLVTLFKLMLILCLWNEYVYTHYYVQFQVKFKHTKEVIRIVNRIRTDNEMAKYQNQKDNYLYTENQRLSKANQIKNPGWIHVFWMIKLYHYHIAPIHSIGLCDICIVIQWTQRVNTCPVYKLLTYQFFDERWYLETFSVNTIV